MEHFRALGRQNIVRDLFFRGRFAILRYGTSSRQHSHAVQFTVQIRGELRGRVRKQEDQQGEWPPLCERSAAPSASGTLKLGTGPALPSDSATRSLPGPV